MARKKSRSAPASSPSRGPASNSSPSTAISPPPKQAHAAPLPAGSSRLRVNPNQPDRSVIEAVVVRASRLLGSLQVAVVALAIFAAVVLLGTLMEHWYNTKIAQELVYRSWWFIGLLGVLSVNIFFAAAKKWPWKKHQTGFVITHIGLLLMLGGGILNAWLGVDAQMYLIDSSEPDSQQQARRRFGPIPQQADYCRYSDTSMIVIQEVSGGDNDPHAGLGSRFKGGQSGGVTKGKPVEEDFEGGPLPWHPDEKTAARTDFRLALLGWLSSPFGKHWSKNLGNNMTLEVTDYFPLSQFVPYGPAEKGKTGMPAARVQFASERFGEIDQWVGLSEQQMLNDGAPAQIELLGFCPAPLLEEFLNPLPPKDRGDKGVLTIIVGGQKVRLSVDHDLNHKRQIAPGVEVVLTEFLPDGFGKEMAFARGPVVKFKVNVDGAGWEEAAAFSGLTGLSMKNGNVAVQTAADSFLFWYDPPDVRLGRGQLIGLMQLVVSDGDKLYYRSFTQGEGGFVKEGSGGVTPGADYLSLFKRMEGRFRVPEFLRSATQQPHYIAANVTPGKETNTDKERHPPALRCQLADGKNKTAFWLVYGDSQTVDLNGRRFAITFKVKTMNLGFEVKLQRALTTVDPGTRMPATYSSWVQLYDREKGIDGERRLITMNEPLDHRGYKFYQSQLEPLNVDDSTGRPVNLSVFTVGHDPGLGIKYLGSICLAAGIFIMFYMRAYFFKKRVVEPPPPAAAPAAPQETSLATGSVSP